MNKRISSRIVLLASVLLITATAWAGDTIPRAAWRRPLGLPLSNPGVTRVKGDIDDGFWQGAPVGGFGSGTFSRTYRGDFARWHIKGGVHKYVPVNANQFAMFQQVEGDANGTARVLMTDHPKNGSLASWQWDYPVGAGEYAAFYPKSWYDYTWEKFPAHVVLEQFSPVLPDNYVNQAIPSRSIDGTRRTLRKQSDGLCSVVLGKHGRVVSHFHARFPGSDKSGKLQPVPERDRQAGTMKGVVFGRNRANAAPNEMDGEFTIAALESPGVEVSYQATFSAEGTGRLSGTISRKMEAGEQRYSWVSMARSWQERLPYDLLFAWREKDYAHGDRVGLPSCGIRSGTEMVSPIHGFLRDERDECVGDCEGWIDTTRRHVERGDRCVAGPICER